MENAADQALFKLFGTSIYLLPISAPVLAVVIAAACAFLPILVGAIGFRRFAIWIVRLEIVLFMVVTWLLISEITSGDLEEKYGNGGAFFVAFIGTPLFFIFSMIFLAVLGGAHSILGSEIRRRKRQIEKADR